ncbi:hypothetical protein LVY74_15430 [Acinetobacter sp. ME22]|uniref:hypothetical protein n=1 Tax=Acinetobacter sp. ME22 TaxID=2904802 RepID=UPI001EDA8245|nr:hypothetical protein [Acinetobacter sp. ME22]MCG2574933.1 hypothetical protein [Acinetobacter sp. ME22]
MMTPHELWISPEARSLGYQLIRELNVAMGFGMASYLDVNHCYNNHEAILIWLDHLLAVQPEVNTSDSVKMALLKHFPESSYVLA